jgi:membrane protease YdiL (CAAX protease family)
VAFNPLLNKSGRLRSGWWIVIFLAVLAALLLPLIFSARGSEAGVPLWQQALVIFLASVLCQTLRRKPLGDLFGPLDGRWLTHLTLGGVFGALLMLVPALALSALGCVRWDVAAGGLSALAPAFALFLAVAITEELLFRGFVFQRLIDGVGAWPAQLIVGFFFVLTHSAALQDAGPLALLAGVNIFLASIMFGLAYLRTRSLAAPIGVHLMANFVQGGVLGFGVSGDETWGVFAPVLTGPDWLTGGRFGLEASVPGLLCVVIAVVILWRWSGAGAGRRAAGSVSPAAPG